MKFKSLLGAVLLALALSACGDESAQSSPEHDAAAEAGDAHGDEDAEGEEHADEHAEELPTAVIPIDIAKAAGISVAKAGPGVIADEHEVQGLLVPIEGQVAKVTGRFPGPVRSLRANVGDQVRAGQVLATIESNLSLSTYTVTAPISGVVTART